MATAEVYLKKLGTPEAQGARLPVMSSDTTLHEIFTLSGTSQPTSGSVPKDGSSYVWVVRARGGAMRANFGAAPVAADSAGNGFVIEAGEQREFGARPGDKAAVITAA